MLYRESGHKHLSLSKSLLVMLTTAASAQLLKSRGQKGPLETKNVGHVEYMWAINIFQNKSYIYNSL